MRRLRQSAFSQPDLRVKLQPITGQDKALLKDRVAVYELARRANPLRWSKETRDWRHVDQVHLNPDTPTSKDVEPEKIAA